MTHANVPLTPLEDTASCPASSTRADPWPTWPLRQVSSGPPSRNGCTATTTVAHKPCRATPAPRPRGPHACRWRMIELIDTWRRRKECSARRIHHELAAQRHRCCLRSVSRWMHRLGISRRKDLGPSGENIRHTDPITAAFPWAHDLSGCEEAREDPRRWCLVGLRT